MNKINIVYIHLKMDGPYFIPVLKNIFDNFVRSKNKPEIVGKKKKGKLMLCSAHRSSKSRGCKNTHWFKTLGKPAT